MSKRNILSKFFLGLKRRRRRFADLTEKITVILSAAAVLAVFGLGNGNLDQSNRSAIILLIVVLVVVCLAADPGDKNDGGENG
jgi:peptidoglycan/LPS O-acetylase OafA/YrhL